MKPAVWVAVLLAAYFAYRFGSNGSEELVKVKDERIGFLNDQVNAYKDRLQGATPDQAAKQISELQISLKQASIKLNRLSPDVYRAITNDQREKILAHRDQLSKAGMVLINADSTSDALRYARQIGSVLKQAGVSELSTMPWVCDEDSTGVFLLVNDVEKVSSDGLLVASALRDAGIAVGVHKTDEPLPPYLSFVLFICRA